MYILTMPFKGIIVRLQGWTKKPVCLFSILVEEMDLVEPVQKVRNSKSFAYGISNCCPNPLRPLPGHWKTSGQIL